MLAVFPLVVVVIVLLVLFVFYFYFHAVHILLILPSRAQTDLLKSFPSTGFHPAPYLLEFWPTVAYSMS